MERNRLSELADKYLRGEASPEEEAQLHKWWDEETSGDPEQVVVTDQPQTPEGVRDRILASLNQEIDSESRPQARVLPFRRRNFMAWTAAAVIIGGIVALTIFRINRMDKTATPAGGNIVLHHIISPGSNRATLKLADGKLIILDSVRQGLLLSEGGTHVAKEGDDRLTYSQAANAGEVTNNTITTPRGGQFHVVLPDGSNAWLNAASSITIPSAFTGDQRNVEVSGEVYFEVSPNSKQPFTVTVSPVPGAPACKILVLGTHFNVDSYNDDSSVRTTLFQGSVKVSGMASSQTELLKPGQEAVLTRENQLSVQDNPNGEDVIAWRQGLFKFTNASIDAVMRQISRWYDVDVHFAGNTNEHFVSTIPRNADLDQVLNILQKTGRVHFATEGRSVTVYPGPGK